MSEKRGVTNLGPFGQLPHRQRVEASLERQGDQRVG